MEDKIISCVNCGRDVHSNFCPECGQAMNVAPISWKRLIVEFSSKWIGLDNKFIRTFSQLITQPQIVINSYLDGNRIRFVGPLTYLIVMSALYILIFDLFDLSVEEYLGRSSEVFRPTEMNSNQEMLIVSYQAKMAQHMRLMVISIIPFMAMSLRIFYKSFNYLQHVMTYSFLSAQLLWVSIFILIVYAITGVTDSYIGLPISIIYFIYAIGRISPQRSRIWTYAKPIIAWTVGFLFFMIAISILSLSMI